MLDDLARGGVKDWRGYFSSHRDQLRTAYGLAEILEISRATVKLYHDESKEDLLGRSAASIVIEEEFDAFLEILLPFLAGQMAVEIESKDVAGDGSEINVRRRVAIPPKYRDDWSRVIYAIEDVTERARAEEHLRQAQKM
jgi:PAS domain S-box-containing protein